MNKGSPDDQGFCIHREAHGNQYIQYICFENSCLLNRQLCRKCVHESHRNHRVGIIDKLVQPLNRLNMNSFYQTSMQDYNFLSGKLQSICEEWQKLNEIFYNNMKQLQNGILFQLTTVMKTFTNDQIDKAYEILLDGSSDIETVNQYVAMINFLNKDYLKDVETVKKFAEVISDRVKRTISKAVSKIDILFKKMQQHIGLLDFTKYQEFKQHPQEAREANQNASVEKQMDKADQGNFKKQEDDTTLPRNKSDLRKNKDVEQDQATTRFGLSSAFNQRRGGFQRYK